MEIVSTRLSNHYLTDNKFDNAQEALEYFGGMQSQDFPAAKWSLGIRLKNSNNIDIEKAYDEGIILRTHMMRPTWHFVAPSDIRWIQKLTSARVKVMIGHYNRRLELTDQVFAKSNMVIAKALQNHNYLTRQELKRVLGDVGITTDIQRLAHLIIWAELDGIITSGPMRGKQFTYALVKDRVPYTKNVEKEEALSILTYKYFRSHGPAQVKDLAWWSGFRINDINEGIKIVGSRLSNINLNGKTYWFSKDTKILENKIRNVFLLSVYDEYFISYTDRSDILKDEYRNVLPIGNALVTSLIIIDGKVEGTWKRKIRKNHVEFRINPFKKLNTRVKEAIEEETEKYAEFFGYQPITIVFA